MTPPGWVGAALPGLPLVLTVDAGGERWTLDARPLSDGDGVELLTEGDCCECPRCEGTGGALRDGRPVKRTTRSSGLYPAACPECGGRGYSFLPVWLRVRFEYEGAGAPLLCLRVPLDDSESRRRIWKANDRPTEPTDHAIRVVMGDRRLRCRWPVPR